MLVSSATVRIRIWPILQRCEGNRNVRRLWLVMDFLVSRAILETKGDSSKFNLSLMT